VAEDLRDIGKVVGVKYKCETMNSFNLLTRDGRKEWRAAGDIEFECGEVGGSGGDVDVVGVGEDRVGRWSQ